MPTIAAIVLADAASTPVSHTLTPVQSTGTIASFRERLGSVVAQMGLVVDVRPPVNGSHMYRVRVNLSVPKGTTVDQVTTVPYVNRAVTEFLVHESSEAQEIKDLFTLHKNALSNTAVADAVQKLEPFY